MGLLAQKNGKATVIQGNTVLELDVSTQWKISIMCHNNH